MRIFFILFCCLVGCHYPETGNQTIIDSNAKSLPSTKRTLVKSDLLQDTVFADGNYLTYIEQDSKCVLTYGNKNIQKQTKYVFDCENPIGKIPYLAWENKEFICMVRPGGGYWNDCLILPLDSGKDLFVAERPLNFDTIRSLVYYLETKDTLIVFVIENLKTHKKIKYDMVDWRQCAVPEDCFEKVNSQKDFIEVKYKASNQNSEFYKSRKLPIKDVF